MSVPENMTVEAWEYAKTIAAGLGLNISQGGASIEWPTAQPQFWVSKDGHNLFCASSAGELSRLLCIVKSAVDVTGKRQAEIVADETGQISKRTAFWAGFASAIMIIVLCAVMFYLAQGG